MIRVPPKAEVVSSNLAGSASMYINRYQDDRVTRHRLGLFFPRNAISIRDGEAPLRPRASGGAKGLSLADPARSAVIGLVGAVRGTERGVCARAQIDLALRSGPSRRRRFRDLVR